MRPIAVSRVAQFGAAFARGRFVDLEFVAREDDAVDIAGSLAADQFVAHIGGHADRVAAEGIAVAAAARGIEADQVAGVQADAAVFDPVARDVDLVAADELDTTVGGVAAAVDAAGGEDAAIADDRGGADAAGELGFDDGAEAAAVLTGSGGLFADGELANAHRVALLV